MVWMLVWSFEGERLAYIGETANKETLTGRIKESTFRPTEPNWEEFFRFDLTSKAGFAELYVGDADRTKSERTKQVKELASKERDTGTIMVGKRNHADWPTWLTTYHANSVLSAMNAYKKRGNLLSKCDQKECESLTALASLPATPPSDDAVDDLDGDRPMQTAFSGMRYRRDPRVRQNVKERAKGKCELCGEEGFRQLDRSRYVECHHIIALANDGEDRVSNVVALCPGHHREAHFGQQARELEEQMIQALQRLGLR